MAIPLSKIRVGEISIKDQLKLAAEKELGPNVQAKNLDSLTKTEKTALVLEALAQAGYSPHQAGKLLGVSRQYMYSIAEKMRSGTLAPLMTKAKKSLELLVEGKPVGAMEKVKGSDVLGAAKLIADRAEPAVQRTESRNLKLTADLTNEERDYYRRLLTPLPELPVLPEGGEK